ncbi:MAG TPA: hypothetical protein VLK65_25215 [Vicinamibacteria bacterium]|nr:hypothetical protein [Vicinamibacteria bacterium]
MVLAASLLTSLFVLQGPSLDFDFFRDRIEPLLMKKRPGHARCVACHQHRAQFPLLPLSADETSSSLDASRRNFESAKRLVVRGEPFRSRLLTMPLAEEAGGAPFHPGGKFWESPSDPEWQTLAEWIGSEAPADERPLLDFELYRARIEPIFLEKRPGHARCVACHQHRAQFPLQPLSPGSASWNEDQSRRNFESAKQLVVPGDPLRSRLLMMPLAEEAGGTPFHPGGKFWESQEDPNWQKLAGWVRGRR